MLPLGGEMAAPPPPHEPGMTYQSQTDGGMSPAPARARSCFPDLKNDNACIVDDGYVDRGRVVRKVHSPAGHRSRWEKFATEISLGHVLAPPSHLFSWIHGRFSNVVQVSSSSQQVLTGTVRATISPHAASTKKLACAAPENTCRDTPRA